MLLSAQDFNDMNVSLQNILIHFRSKMKQINSHTQKVGEKYEWERTKNLYKTLSQDVCKQIDAVYGGKVLMRHTIEECRAMSYGVQSVFESWELLSLDLKRDLKEVFKAHATKENKDAFITLNVCEHHKQLYQVRYYTPPP